MLKWLLLLLLIPLASASLLVQSPNVLTVYRGVQTVFNVSLVNNNSFEVYNVSLSNQSGFNFPIILNMSVGGSVNAFYDYMTDELFSNRLFQGRASFLYLSFLNSSPVVVPVNVSLSGFSPVNSSIFLNDSVEWFNNLNYDIVIKDLASNFSELNIPVNGSVLVQYNGVASYSFYEQSMGSVGYLQVLERPSEVFVHDSSLDVDVLWIMTSVLNPSLLELNLIPSNLSANVNQTIQGLVQLRNQQNFEVKNAILSASRWVSFSENNFSIAPFENKYLFFNITPSVSRTNDTNVSFNIAFKLSSLNAPDITNALSLFVAYRNFDLVNGSGVQYLISLLGVNQTAEACMQHENEPGFEVCRDLRAWAEREVHIIEELPASHTISEDNLKVWISNMNDLPRQLELRDNQLNRQQAELDDLKGFIRDNVSEALVYISNEAKKKDDAIKDLGWQKTAILLIVLVLIVSFGGYQGWKKYSLWKAQRKALT